MREKQIFSIESAFFTMVVSTDADIKNYSFINFCYNEI